MTKLYLSGPFDYKGRGWGYAHYSYGFAMDSFKNVVQKNDEIAHVFQYPFSIPKVRSIVGSTRKPTHISFLPPDVALIVPRAFNVCVFAWEFDKLPKKSKENNGIFKKDYEQQLKTFDAVITLSTYAQETLKQYGIDSYVLPSATMKPLDVSGENIDNLDCYSLSTVTNFYKDATRSRPLKQVFEDSPYDQRFLYVLNPHDIRKNFGNLVTAFNRFVEDNPKATLILKMTAQGDLTKLQETAFRREFPSFNETTFKNVYFIPQKLTDAELQLLMQSCETYISPSRAEGQNLPLCEAMYSGRITIAPNHTSMSDFVDSSSTILLDYGPWVIDETTHKYSDFWGMSWFNVPEETIFNALNAKMLLTDEEKQAIIETSKQNIEKFSSEEAVLSKWQSIKDDLGL